MEYYKLKFKDGTFKIVRGKSSLEIVRKYDLCASEHANTHMVELSGEQRAIAISNFEEGG